MNQNAASTRDTSPDDAPDQWLSVSQAAARLGVSERTIQRRCKSGKLAARMETGDDGAAWLIGVATLPTSVATGADTLPTGVDTSFESESVPDGIIAPPSVATLPTGADTLTTLVATDESARIIAVETENTMLREALEREREAVQRERENADQWRAQVEAANRQASESSAALREYLKISAKSLPSREYSQGAPDAAETGAQAPIKSATGKLSGAAKSGGKREPRPLWKLILGLR